MCSSHATVRGLLHEIPLERGAVIVDTEASPEHLSRGTTEAVDVMLVVAEPYFKSLETARRYAGLGTDLGIRRVSVVANKISNDEEAEAIATFCESHGLEVLDRIPFDETLGEADRRGLAPLDLDGSARSIAAIERLADRLMAEVG